ncbi:vitamin K-dependent gamma-carboxylase-like protein [Streptomyces puniciscabiei]|uniref:Vitamin K-dependent gamma-carboxylase-like protein n=1 Tax=Streptomyces puniciscabiei TaxID=164348 RepID=A0A542UFG3_9ACTN|nr:HTTM domain-containing protein [Streptomyces puniciscabiei]TQK97793.1 vitamin K-dependent gamma-carboxylase-like protein [Streptomyces puniciscabiei]
MNRLSLTLSRGIAKVTESALGPYQSAVIRIGFAGTWLLFLLREFPHRQELYGPAGPWAWNLAKELTADNHAFTALLWSDGQLWFECFYLLAILAGAALLLGWRTRTASVLFMVGVLSLQNRSVFVGDGGDNVLHLMSFYLVFTRCGQVWSLDARRAARAQAARARGERVLADRVGPVLWVVSGLALLMAAFTGRFDNGWLIPALLWTAWVTLGLWWAAGRWTKSQQPRILLDVVANVLHNGALFVIMAEACLIYATAGWYKIQGSRWQDGTAVYYPLHLDYFSPWPGLADLMSSSGTIMMAVAYGTVMVQVAFPFTLVNRRVKNVLLVLMMTEHAVIAVVLGLPFFSLAMITADAVFLPTPFLRRLGALVARARGRLVRHEAARTVPAPRSPEESSEDSARDRSGSPRASAAERGGGFTA